MGDLYGTGQPPAIASSPEEMSTFISHILHGNSSSASPKFLNSPLVTFSHPPHRTPDALPSSSVDPAAGFRFDLPETDHHGSADFSDSRSYFWKEKLENEGPSKRKCGAASDTELGDFSCDIEVPDESDTPGDIVRHRSSSKRSRTAEIHNMSEKRRRSRINEKMKALQDLIPNSNKTDKASMLDEAIEYLKQLQLQVQMLTMRNGLSLHPMCLPGMQTIAGISFGERGYTLNGQKTEDNVLHLPAQCSDAVLMPTMNLAGASFGLEPLYPLHYGGPSSSPKEVCRESDQLDTDRTMKASSSSRVS